MVLSRQFDPSVQSDPCVLFFLSDQSNRSDPSDLFDQSFQSFQSDQFVQSDPFAQSDPFDRSDLSHQSNPLDSLFPAHLVRQYNPCVQ